MIQSINIKIGGSAGAGIKSIGTMLAKALARCGLHVFEYPEYPSLIRGGHNTEQIYASTQSAFSQVRAVDILLAMDQKTIDIHLPELHDGSVVIYDGASASPPKRSHGIEWLDVPLRETARQHGSDIMANNVGLAVVASLMGIPLSVIKGIVSLEFSDKSAEVVESNQAAVTAGYSFTDSRSRTVRSFQLDLKTTKLSPLLLTGNDAISLGAIAAGLGLYAAYPMTPASSILHTLAANQNEFGFVVRQPEDELAAANMVIGAMHMGVRAMCGTSGGGFALMTETLALSGITETPMVIVVAQRPGPATGMPTWTEQGELRYLMHAGHGEFPRFILAPGDVSEAFRLTADAFNLAERYQSPVIILTDKYLGESAMTTSTLPQASVSVDRGLVLTPRELSKRKNFQRYELTATGVSPRSLPGFEHGVYCANSYEHGYHGLADETSQMRIWQHEKRLRKGISASRQLPGPELIGPKNAAVTVITWGSSKLPALQALHLAKEQTMNILHFSYMWPLNLKAVKRALAPLSSRPTLFIEGNATGQFQSVLMEHFGFEPTAYLRKYDGRPIYPEEILSKTAELLLI